MTYPTGQIPQGPSPEWRVWSPQRVGDFHWLLIPQKWFEARDPLLSSILNFVYGAVLIVEVILLMPTVGPIRLAVHHARSPGWYLECRYGTVANLPTNPRVKLQTRTKRQAKRTERALEREFRNGADFNAPAVRTAIARNEVVVLPTTPPPPVVSGTN